MAVRNDFAAGEVLAAADLNDTFASKLDLAGGKILQIVRATDSTTRSTTSLTLVDVTGMSVTITPEKSDSAILLIAAFSGFTESTNDDTRMRFAITDSSDNPISGSELHIGGTQSLTGTGTRQSYLPIVMMAWATPATTSAVTYKLRFRSQSAGITSYVFGASITSQIFAIEVSA